MATIDWPEPLIPQSCQMLLRKSGTQFSSPFNGTLQAVDFIAERWVLSVSLAQMAARNPRGVGSFCNRLAGGVERVRGWHFGHNRGVPVGTLRGAPTLSVAHARGDVALQLAGALSRPNLLAGGGMELDTNGDGLADGWIAYNNGSTSGIVYSRPAGFKSTFAQRMAASTLGTSAIDNVGIGTAGFVAATAEGVYSLSGDVISNYATLQVRLHVDWYTAADVLISGSGAVHAGPLAWQRLAAQGLTAPATAAKARLYVWMQAHATGGAMPQIFVDNLQWEAAPVATAYAGSASLRADDMLGAGGQLFQVASDTLLNDAGAGSVPVVNRVRATIASGTAVVWNRPTVEFNCPANQAGPVYSPGAIDSTGLDLVEVW